MKTPKFNFVPERQLGEVEANSPFRVSIYKAGTLVFPTDAVDIYELDTKFIRLFADKEKRSIGWSILEGGTNLEELNDARKLVKTANGNIIVSIRKLLNKIGIEDFEDGWKNLNVSIYKSSLHTNDIYHVEIPLKEVPSL